MGIGGLLCLDLHRGGLVGEGPDEGIPVAKLGDGDGDLCLDDGVDAADFVCDLPCTLEEDGVVNVPSFVGHEGKRAGEMGISTERGGEDDDDDDDEGVEKVEKVERAERETDGESC